MTTRPWRHSGARSNGKRWSQAPVGPRTGCGGRSSNTLKPFTTGAGSTALWGINHLWTSNTKTMKNEKDSSTCVHKKGGRERLFLELSEHRRTQANISEHKRTFPHSAAPSEFMSFGSPQWPRAAPATGRSPIRVNPRGYEVWIGRPETLRQQLQDGREMGHHKDLLAANQQVDYGRCSRIAQSVVSLPTLFRNQGGGPVRFLR